MPRTDLELADVLGWGRLALDATVGLSTVVEGMHAEIVRAWLLGLAPPGPRTFGVPRLVYGTIRGAAWLAGLGLDAAVAARAAGAPAGTSSAAREARLAILNGVIGDHLAVTRNPLAIPLGLRHGGRSLPLDREALARALPGATPKLLVLVHGLCASDLVWRRNGHDHGEALARDLRFTPVYARYASGRGVPANGRELSAALEALAAAWPVPLEEIAILAHSMGGLVARSACREAERAGHRWRGLLRSMVFLGTPHHGAPLERGGSWVDAALGASRFTAPLAWVGEARSAGIVDLRHGNVADEGAGRGRAAPLAALPTPVALPEGVRCFAVAGTIRGVELVGDGLVTVPSALGRHADPARALAIPHERCWIARGAGHLQLLDSPAVYERVRGWLAG